MPDRVTLPVEVEIPNQETRPRVRVRARSSPYEEPERDYWDRRAYVDDPPSVYNPRPRRDAVVDSDREETSVVYKVLMWVLAAAVVIMIAAWAIWYFDLFRAPALRTQAFDVPPATDGGFPKSMKDGWNIHKRSELEFSSTQCRLSDGKLGIVVRVRRTGENRCASQIEGSVRL